MFTVFYTILGACLASFVTCYAQRRQLGLSQWGRSHCMSCKTPIAPPYLIPIIGYFLAQGHCKTCHAPIPKAFPCLELLGAVVGLLLSYQAIHVFEPLLQLLIGALLLLMSLDDQQTQWIHDRDLWCYGLLVLIDGCCFNTLFWSERLIGLFLVAFPLALIRWRFPQSLGSGDILFMAISGFYLGMVDVSYAFLIGIFTALAYGIVLLVLKKATKKTAIPLIPFLSIGVLSLMIL